MSNPTSQHPAPSPRPVRGHPHHRRGLARATVGLAFRTLGPLAPALAARVATRFWSRTQRTAEREWERRTLSEAETGTHIIDGCRVATYVWGAGEPVLLAHGWNGHAAHLAAFAPPLAAAGFQVVAFDAPGHGRSTGRRTSLVEISRVLAELVRQHGTPRAIIGHSFGGLCAADALGQGLPARSLVCIATPASMAWLVEIYIGALGMPEAVAQAFRRRIEERLGPERWKRLSSARELACPQQPLLVVHDHEDPAVPWSQGKELADAWPGARLLSTRGLGHLRILSDPEVVRQVAEFVAGES
jgi:pimeloyl-ACP methyl ester carboxylesterase